MPTDTELIARARAGEKDAFAVLIRRYQGLVYGLAYHRLGHFADAEDIAQEVFVKAFRHLERIEQPEHFAAWLRAVTVNECIGWLRRKRPIVSLEDAEVVPSLTSSAVAEWRQRELETEIRQIVEALPEPGRLIVSLYYLSGLSHKEIGGFLGLTANAIAQQLHRARRQLKVLLADMEEEYAMNRLPDDFAQEVLRRVTLYPVEEGYVTTNLGEGDVQGLMLGVGERGSDESIITLWMRRDDLAALAPAKPGEDAGEKKKRAMHHLLRMMEAFDIIIRQAVLRLADARLCFAVLHISRQGSEMVIDLRPSDALFLATHVKAPVYVEESVVRQGNVGEDGVPVPEERIDVEKWRAEIHAISLHSRLQDKAFALGLSPEEMVDTIRYRVDESAGVIHLWLEALPDRQAAFDLAEYRLGVDILLQQAGQRFIAGLWHNGKAYTAYYSLLEGDIRTRIVPGIDAGRSGEMHQ